MSDKAMPSPLLVPVATVYARRARGSTGGGKMEEGEALLGERSRVQLVARAHEPAEAALPPSWVSIAVSCMGGVSTLTNDAGGDRGTEHQESSLGRTVVGRILALGSDVAHRAATVTLSPSPPSLLQVAATRSTPAAAGVEAFQVGTPVVALIPPGETTPAGRRPSSAVGTVVDIPVGWCVSLAPLSSAWAASAGSSSPRTTMHQALPPVALQAALAAGLEHVYEAVVAAGVLARLPLPSAVEPPRSDIEDEDDGPPLARSERALIVVGEGAEATQRARAAVETLMHGFGLRDVTLVAAARTTASLSHSATDGGGGSSGILLPTPTAVPDGVDSPRPIRFRSLSPESTPQVLSSECAVQGGFDVIFAVESTGGPPPDSHSDGHGGPSAASRASTDVLTAAAHMAQWTARPGARLVLFRATRGGSATTSQDDDDKEQRRMGRLMEACLSNSVVVCDARSSTLGWLRGASSQAPGSYLSTRASSAAEIGRAALCTAVALLARQDVVPSISNIVVAKLFGGGTVATGQSVARGLLRAIEDAWSTPAWLAASGATVVRIE